MPWRVEERDGKWAILKKEGDKWVIVGYSKTKEKAQASVRVRYANE